MRRRPHFLLAVAMGLLVALSALPETAHASGSSDSSKASAVSSEKRKSSRRRGRIVCRGKGAERKCQKVRGRFRGHVVRNVRTEPLPRPSGEIHIVNPPLKAEIKVNIYNPDGSFNEEALAQLDEIFQCRRTREVRAVDPRLYEILAIIYDHYGQKRIELTSGFRYQRNEGSRHFHASAMDIKIPGVSAKRLYELADSLDTGGMGIGIYPRQGFVHIDFRAPGQPSYRWTDTSKKGSGKDKRPSRLWRRSRKPNT